MEDVKRLLPPDVDVKVVYRRTDLVNHVLHTVEKNLFEGAVLVIAVLFAFLGNLRAGLIVASVIPLSMLFAVTMMQKVGIAGSLMSLGAIDFGLVVDSSVVMVENCVRRTAHDQSTRSRRAIIRDAAIEVRKPTMFGELIIMIVYLPILTLQGVEGKMFRPMALTVIFALAGSMILSLTLMPVLASLGLPRKMAEKDTILDRIAHFLLRPFLGLSLKFPVLTLTSLMALTVGMLALATTFGSEFIPGSARERSSSTRYGSPAWGSTNRSVTGRRSNRSSRKSSRTRSRRSGPAPAPPRSPPTRWAWNSATCSSR